jgi:hypothetical protein
VKNCEDARHRTLTESLRQRFAAAERRDDAEAKQALFREAVYLGIPPEAFVPSPQGTSADPTGPA